jgi:hypothetical protein
VPWRLITCGLPAALSAIEIDPLALPVVRGAKVAVMVQNAFRAREAGERGQLSLSEKGVPDTVMFVITRGADPVFVRRAECPVLVVPIA